MAASYFVKVIPARSQTRQMPRRRLKIVDVLLVWAI